MKTEQYYILLEIFVFMCVVDIRGIRFCIFALILLETQPYISLSDWGIFIEENYIIKIHGTKLVTLCW